MGQFVTLALIILFGNCQCNNLLRNPGFESPIVRTDWKCKAKCVLTRESSDVKEGTYSVKVSNRKKTSYELFQKVNLNASTTYYIEFYVKLLNLTEGSLYDEMGIVYRMTDTTGNITKLPVAIEPKVTPERGWIKIAADFLTYPTNKDYTQTAIYIYSKMEKVDFLVDSGFLTEIADNPDWKTEAEERIEQNRKRNITINLDVSSNANLSPEDLQLEVKLERHLFPFGSAVRAEYMAGSDTFSVNYRNRFFENFEFAVFHNAHKWKAVERTEGVETHPFEAMEALNERNIPMRGHCLFYDKPKNVPSWLRNRTGEDLWTAIHKRLNYTLTRPQYKGVIKDWDLNNEQLHGDFFEQGTNNANFMIQLLNETQAYDNENLRLFLNQNVVIRGGRYTQALVNSALWYVANGAPLGAIAGECHLRGPVTAKNITAFKKRMDMLQAANLPVYVTELDIRGVENKTDLANMIDDFVTLAFSHPAIHGLVLWGFHNSTTGIHTSAMFDEDFTANAAGERWIEMFHTRWRTKVTFNLTSTVQTFEFRGFQGNYTATLLTKNDRTEIKRKKFFVKNDKTIDITQ